MRLRRSSKFNSANARFKGLRPFKVQNGTAPQFKVLSPLSYESGRAEYNALERGSRGSRFKMRLRRSSMFKSAEARFLTRP